LYALPAWDSFLTADLIGKIDLICVKPSDGVIMGNVKILSELFYDADMKLLRSMLHSIHGIHQLLPHRKLCQ